jgi:hypothetical protein
VLLGATVTRDKHKIDFLNRCRVRARITEYGSTDADGMNGAFIIPFHDERKSYQLGCIASDQLGWEHVSVTDQTSRRSQQICPTWPMMCRIKRAFWDDDETVMEYHVPMSEWINEHPGCLHLWKPIGIEIPRPPSLFVRVPE